MSGKIHDLAECVINYIFTWLKCSSAMIISTDIKTPNWYNSILLGRNNHSSAHSVYEWGMIGNKDLFQSIDKIREKGIQLIMLRSRAD